MAERTLTFALFGNTYQHDRLHVAQQLIDRLTAHGARLLVEKEYLDFLNTAGISGIGDAVVFNSDNRQEADFAVSLGGDGTFLHAAASIADTGTPIIGVNMGRLGFLANVGTADFDAYINAIYAGDYTVESRSVIKVDTDGEQLQGYCCALNDVALLKRDTASMITIRAEVDGEHLATYQADGLIVATPTGSTAYSLSNGGPVIVPSTPVFVLTAVAPHSLNMRSIVIPDKSALCLTVESRNHSFLVAVDGRSEKLHAGTTVRLTRARYNIKVVKRPATSYFSTLREKMMWGADAR